MRKPIKVENPRTITCTGQDVRKFLHRPVTACHIMSAGKQQKTTAGCKISPWMLEVIAFTTNLKDHLADLTGIF